MLSITNNGKYYTLNILSLSDRFRQTVAMVKSSCTRDGRYASANRIFTIQYFKVLR